MTTVVILLLRSFWWRRVNLLAYSLPSVRPSIRPRLSWVPLMSCAHTHQHIVMGPAQIELPARFTRNKSAWWWMTTAATATSSKWKHFEAPWMVGSFIIKTRPITRLTGKKDYNFLKNKTKELLVLIFFKWKKNRVYNKAQLIDIIYKESSSSSYVYVLHDRTGRDRDGAVRRMSLWRADWAIGTSIIMTA